MRAEAGAIRSLLGHDRACFRGQVEKHRPGFPSNRRRFPSNRRPLPSNRRRLPSNRRRFPSNRRRLPSNRRRLPSNRRRPPSNRRRLPSNRRRLPPNRRRLPSNRRRLPATAVGYPPTAAGCPIVCPNNELATGRPRICMKKKSLAMMTGGSSVGVCRRLSACVGSSCHAFVAVAVSKQPTNRRPRSRRPPAAPRGPTAPVRLQVPGPAPPPKARPTIPRAVT